MRYYWFSGKYQHNRNMKNQIAMQKFLEKYYWKNDSVILGCSGWPDSMYLLYKILQTPYAKNLVICYFNHKTRPQTETEETYLEKLAFEKWCKFESAECDFEKIQKLYPSKSFEELAREKRYQFFDAVMNIYNSKYVLTWHHLDDRIETCIFNMLRGSKLTGLINMKNPTPPQSPSFKGEVQGWVLRPLLDLEKSDILKYLDENKLKYFIDETNTNTDITRNKIRHELIPKFSEIHPHHKWNIRNLLEYFEELKNHVDDQVEIFLSLSSPENPELKNKNKSFEISDFLALSPFLQKEVIREIFFKTNNNSTIWLSEWNIAEVLKFISDE